MVFVPSEKFSMVRHGSKGEERFFCQGSNQVSPGHHMRVEEKTSRHRHCRAGITLSHITHCYSKTGLQTFHVSSICTRNIEFSRIFQLHMAVSPVTSMWRPVWHHHAGKNTDSGPDMILCMHRGCSWMPNWHQSSSRLSFLLAIYFLMLLLLLSIGFFFVVFFVFFVFYLFVFFFCFVV